ncbi:hypothetical protein ACJRO7_020931 [Eucalyptus globulus]|uniref:Uncharacterized protein n=1 Tax=Eucalyptus globulus TaxID=34317 RepID=A0ABD3KN36_EUCGL
MPKGDIPRYVLKEAFKEGTTDPKDGSVMDVNDPNLEDDSHTPVYSVDDANWSEEEGEIVEQEEGHEDEPIEEELKDKPEDEPKAEPKEEEPEEEETEDDSEEEESEEDPQDDPKYDPDED